MGRFHGKVGYLITVEDSSSPGVFKEVVTEKSYYGDVTRYARRWDNGESLNSNISLNNVFEIIADSFAYQNLGYIRYVEWMGIKYEVTSYEIARPRIILNVGGVYNGPTS